MKTIKVSCYENQNSFKPDASKVIHRMMDGYQVQDPLEFVGTYAFTVHEVTSDHDICEMAWELGNRMISDDDARRWPSQRRSMSIGDVVVIGETAWKAISIGWETVPTEDLNILSSVG